MLFWDVSCGFLQHFWLLFILCCPVKTENVKRKQKNHTNPLDIPQKICYSI